eukprot:8198297-Pyramimonas_sp.AAC.1
MLARARENETSVEDEEDETGDEDEEGKMEECAEKGSHAIRRQGGAHVHTRNHMHMISRVTCALVHVVRSTGPQFALEASPAILAPIPLIASARTRPPR